MCWTTYLCYLDIYGKLEWETPVGELSPRHLVFNEDGSRIAYASSGYSVINLESYSEIRLLTDEGDIVFESTEIDFCADSIWITGDTLVFKENGRDKRVNIKTGEWIKLK